MCRSIFALPTKRNRNAKTRTTTGTVGSSVRRCRGIICNTRLSRARPLRRRNAARIVPGTTSKYARAAFRNATVAVSLTPTEYPTARTGPTTTSVTCSGHFTPNKSGFPGTSARLSYTVYVGCRPEGCVCARGGSERKRHTGALRKPTASRVCGVRHCNVTPGGGVKEF